MATMQNGTKGEAEKDCRKAYGLAAKDASGFLAPFTFSRRNNGDDDVTIKILYCGICHSDLHTIKNEWKNAIYPVVPGHEIVGLVTETGRNVQKFKLGDRAGVGCLVNSCRSCDSCDRNLENYCPKLIFTYNSVDTDGTITYGGYSDSIVVNEHFVVKFPENLPMDKGAPLLCAGITVYSPMKNFGLDEPGKHLGVVGLGGLGHVAVKFGKAFGMKVTVISTSLKKKDEAISKLGADAFLVSSDSAQMQAAMGSMDGIINTVSAKHDVVPLIFLLKTHGKMIMVGGPEHPLELPIFPLLMGGKIIAGSCIGGLKQTQEMIDFAAKNGITAEIELIKADYVNEAMERLAKADVRYRFVIDVGNSLKSA
uniref:cinnamyl-alcohol dehydrogenase n=1 Tax=Caladenia plicata TaxID=672428 RepID=A0A218MY41_9ASPA|nr:alcohol dehydrogenase 3 [Caladenia plicata]